MNLCLSSVVAICCIAGAHNALGQVVRFLDAGAPHDTPSFYGVSANERGDVAYTGTFGFDRFALLVSASGEVQQIPLPNPASFGQFVLGVADDGSVIVRSTILIDDVPQTQMHRFRDGASTLIGQAPNSTNGASSMSPAGHSAFLVPSESSQLDDLITIDPHGVMSNRGNPNARPNPTGMNRHGNVVGGFPGSLPPWSDAFFLDQTGEYRALNRGVHASAGDVNDHNVVVGSYARDGGYPRTDTMFLWEPNSDRFDSINAPSGFVSVFTTSINNNELVGGSLVLEGDPLSYEAFLWSAETGFIDPHDFLPETHLGTRLVTIYDVTDSGFVVGTAEFTDGTWGVFTLQIPAPTSSFAFGAMFMLPARRRRR